ncbi:MAG TPA: M23 family metallopeptidase [Pyrinomonadaceae bacterium]|jgi:murein DD-endopeptidase MepM/ murein hydrolase activator NlpD|nr:M23 family metallopeptidase [Pyrinomonadaceae bacterium]
MALGPRARVLLLAALVFAGVAALVWYLSYGYWSQPVTPLRPPRSETVETPTPGATPQADSPATAPSADAVDTPAASPTPAATPQPPQPQSSTQTQGGAADAALASMRLLLPVQGVRAEDLRDTFGDSRSEGRVHDAIDIMAPRNSPVLAAADGRVVKLHSSVRGGVTLYQLAAADEHVVLYYAHLERYADGLSEGHLARRGETIAYVGDTGNVTPGNTHLHFQIYRVADPKNFYTGDNINPYPLLRGAQ